LDISQYKLKDQKMQQILRNSETPVGKNRVKENLLELKKHKILEIALHKAEKQWNSFLVNENKFSQDKIVDSP